MSLLSRRHHTAKPTNNGPLYRYQQRLHSGEITLDASQQQAIEAVEELYQQLTKQPNSTIPGLYLWGKVGRGKSLIMDLLADSVGEKLCLRQHFHGFMASIHQQLKQHSGQPEPLNIIAKNIASRYRLLCFDEFYVDDIGDAMLLGRLLQFLFDQRVILVATSNAAPHQLYANGLQRQRFLTAIAAIEANTTVLNLDGNTDHRHRQLASQPILFFERGHGNQAELYQTLLAQAHIGRQACQQKDAIDILGRSIPVYARQKKQIAFLFEQLCEGPRSAFDYLEIGRRYNTVIILSVPVLSGSTQEYIKARGTEDGPGSVTNTGSRAVCLAPQDDAARRFIAAIDEFYERRVNVLLTTRASSLEDIYSRGSLTFEFERTKSRLTEMASDYYQRLDHRDN